MPEVTKDRKKGPDDIAISRALGNYETAIKELREAKYHIGKSKIEIIARVIGYTTMGNKNLHEALLEEVH